MKRITLFVVSLLLSSFLYSCGSLTYITDTWEKQGFTGKKFNKVVVLAIAKDNRVARRMVEDATVRELKANGINAIISYDILPNGEFDKDSDGKVDNQQEAEESIKSKMKDLNADGVLVLKLKDVKTEQKYVPGVQAYIPTNYYAPYYNYYFMSYNMVYSPGYYVNNTDVYIESNIYDLQKNEMVYSLLSETVNPTSVGDFTKSFSTSLAKTLVDQKVFLK
jgi:hypothetical protein